LLVQHHGELATFKSTYDIHKQEHMPLATSADGYGLVAGDLQASVGGHTQESYTTCFYPFVENGGNWWFPKSWGYPQIVHF